MIDLDEKLFWEVRILDDGDRCDYNLWDYSGARPRPVLDPRLSWRELLARFESRSTILSFFVIGGAVVAIWGGGTVAYYTPKSFDNPD